MLDWSKLLPYDGNAWKSFEEFCYQVAKSQFGNLGDFTPIDDSGGGDGVEFYLTFPDGTQWGWQAKYYYPSSSLDGRKRPIINSLKKSMKVHPKMNKWFLCTPRKFTSTGIRWFNELKEKNNEVELIHWCESDFNDFIRSPQLEGIKNHFFGELELSLGWFKDQVETQLKYVEKKYTPELHTETNLDRYLDKVIINNDYLKSIDLELKKFYKLIQDVKNSHDSSIKNINYVFKNEINDRILFITDYLLKECISIYENIFTVNNLYIKGKYDMNIMDFKYKMDEFETKIQEFRKIKNQITLNVIEFKPEIKDEQKELDIIKSQYENLYYRLYELINSAYYLNKITERKSEQLHIIGRSGVGKTHISCQASRKRVDDGKPAILIHGKSIIGDRPLETQLSEILDIPPSYSWESFLKALQSAAEAHKCKIPFLIDALNEVQYIDVLIANFPSFIYKILKYPNIVVITTCRPSYSNVIWPPNGPENSYWLSGFDYESATEAIIKYFSWYKLKCDLTFVPHQHFTNPLFLRLFCESKNKDRSEEVEISIGEQNILNIFNDFLQKSNRIISDKLSKLPQLNLVQKALNRFANTLWENNEAYFPFIDSISIIDQEDLSKLNWPESMSFHLLDEDLLINREFIERNEKIGFTYGLLGGYLISRSILSEKTPSEIESFIKSKEYQEKLVDPDITKRHPLHEDILTSLTLMLPEYSGKHLYEFIQDAMSFSYSINGLFEMENRFITEPQKKVVTELFDRPENRHKLFENARITYLQKEHPLNIRFWNELITNLNLPDKDVYWSEFIRRYSSEYEAFLNSIIEQIANIHPDKLDSDLVSLYAILCMNLLTSTVRSIRDKATKALFHIGRYLPSILYSLVDESFHKNDLYILERIIASAYGVTLLLSKNTSTYEINRKLLDEFTLKLYSNIFSPTAEFSTTHIVIRDYARNTIKSVLRCNPDLLDSAQIEDISFPYSKGGIRKWKISTESEEDDYKDGSGPIHTDFGNYILGNLIIDRRNYDFSSEEYLKVKGNLIWRMYDLGYSHSTFAQIDREIDRLNWNLGRISNGKKVDRYGKKYSWIAYYELVGFRHDEGLLPEQLMDDPRILYVDIDPTFPEKFSHQPIEMDYLGDRTIPNKDWISIESPPDIGTVLYRKKIDDAEGPWILLDGFINQADEELKRSFFSFPRGLLVKKADQDRLFKLLSKQHLGGRWLPEIEEDYYLFGGEIPQSDLFSNNENISIKFVVDQKMENREMEIIAKHKDGRVFPTLLELMFYLGETGEAGISNVEMIKETVSIEKEVNVYEEIEVILPVRYYSWEDYHSVVNRAGQTILPMKQFSEHLGLVQTAASFNLNDKEGKISSMSISWGNLSRNGYILCYFRQDLFDKYLEENELSFIWANWGERLERMGSYKVFQSIQKYEQNISC